MLIIFPSIAYALTFIFVTMNDRRTLHDASSDDAPVMASAKTTLFRLVLFILLVIHGFACYQDMFTPQGLVFGFAQALSLMALVGVLLYWIEGWFFTLEGMLPLVIAIASVCSFLPVVFDGAIISTKTVDSPWFKLHCLTANIAYGVLLFAAIQALLMTWQEKKLRTQNSLQKPSFFEKFLLGKPSGALDQLPSLITMENILFNILWIGFGLLSFTVFSGVFFSETLFNRALVFDHKTVFSVISWLMFAFLLFAHKQFGLRGARALKWVLSSFGVLLLAYVGSRFVLEVILHRA